MLNRFVELPGSPARALLLLCCAFCSPLVGQETEDAPTKSGYYQRTADGTLIPLSEFGIQDADLEALIRQRQQRAAPQYEIVRVAITGSVRDKIAYLDAVITVELNVADRWVSVPLAMDDGQLTTVVQHKGHGRAVFDRERSRETGTRHWFLTGEGTHQLTLSMVVPVREPAHLRHNLRLKLPDAVATQFTLDVAERSVITEAPRGSGHRTTSRADGTRFEIWGLGTQFILQWEVRPDVADSRPFLRSATTMNANLATDPFSVTARQTLTMQQGSQAVFDITLPTGFLPARTEPQQLDPGGRIAAVDLQEDAGTVRITLAEPLTDRLDLTWVLVPQDAEVAREWKFSGFLVAGAQEQTTELDLTPPDGVAIQETRAAGIQQQRTRSARPDRRVLRCRFLSAASELVVQLRDIEPFFTVTPRIGVDVTENQLRLEARFRVRVLRGSLQQLTLSWPGFSEQNWRLLPLSPTDGSTEWTSGDVVDDKLSIDLLTRMSGSFEIAVGAVRTLEKPEAFAMSLPGIEAQTRQPTAFILGTETNLEVQISDSDATSSTPIPLDPSMTAGFDLPFESRNLRAFLVRSDQREFQAELRARDRLLSAGSKLVLGIDQSTISIDQTISYQLDFDHIAELRLTIPDGIDPTVSLPDGTRLRRTAVGQDSSRYLLPQPLTGSFDVIVQYRIPYDTGGTEVRVPAVIAADAPFLSFRVGVKPGARFRVTPLGDWTPAFSKQLEAEWSTDQPDSQIRLSLDSPLGGMARRFSVTRALIQTKVAGSIAETRANFVLQGRFEQQILNVPADARISSVTWNGRALAPQSWRVDTVSGTRVLAVDQSQNAGSGVLSVDYRAPTPVLSWARSLELSCPTMPEDVPVDEVIWQIILPTGEHLSAFDPRSTPCFEWVLASFGWRREPLPEFVELESWLRKGTGRESQVVRTVAGNAYAFHQPGLSGALRVATLDQSFVLLLGSGAAFITVFCLIRFSPGRFAIVLPAVGLLFSLLSLRYAAALQLLAQPMAVGVLLAAVAHWFDRRRYRRGYAPYGMERSVATVAQEPVSDERTASYPPALSGSAP